MDREHATPLVVGQADERVERGRDPAVGGLRELLLRARYHALGLGDGGDPRVVDPDIDGAELRLRGLERTLDLRTRADVGPDRHPADEVSGPRRGLCVDVEHGDSCAVRRKADANGMTEARPATGHDGALAVERHGSTTARPSTSPSLSRR